MSYAPEVIADSSGQWTGNALRFASREEAEAYASNLASRWLLVRETRVIESQDRVNYTYVGDRLVEVKIEHVYPPIPERHSDWAAYRDPEGRVGRGATEAAAVADLLEQEEG